MIKINMGCGNAKMPGYIGVDVRQTDCTDIVTNADNLPFEDKSVDEIFARYIIEHFNRQEIKKVLHEWNRVLKIGGKVVIHTLNVEELNRILSNKFISWDHYNYLLFGGQDYKENTHKLALSYNYLVELLRPRGFENCKIISQSKRFEDLDKGIDPSKYAPLIVIETFKIKQSEKIKEKGENNEDLRT